MSKIVFITKPIEELTEGINELEVGLITNGKPSPYPHTISMEYTGEFKKDVLMTPREASEKGCPKYVADVEVRFDEETGSPSFKLASDIKEKAKATIEADPKYIANIKEERAKEYAKEVDGLNFKLVEMLADAVITNKIVIDDPEAKALAQSIKDKKKAIKDKIK